MKTYFSEGKLMRQFGNYPLSKRTPLFQLTPLSLSNFFMTPLFVQILKTRNPPSFRGEETMYQLWLFLFLIPIELYLPMWNTDPQISWIHLQNCHDLQHLQGTLHIRLSLKYNIWILHCLFPMVFRHMGVYSTYK